MSNEKPQVVLVIEDKEDIWRDVQNLFEGRNLVVRTVEDCGRASEVLKREAIDLVLVDIRLPEMNVPDVLTDFGQHLPDTPVVVIAGEGQFEEAEEALSLGAWDCVFDPMGHKSLFLNTIEHAVAHGRLMRESSECRRRITEYEERNRVLLENIGSDLVYFDLDYRIVMANKQVHERSGLGEREIVGKSLFDLFPKPRAELFIKRIDQIVKDKKGGYFEDLIELPDGDRWFLSSVQPIQHLHGEVIGVLFVATDMTAQKEAEEALRDSEERYRLIVENAITPITRFSPDGRILMINAVAARNMGGKPEDFVGKSLFDLFPKDLADQMLHTIGQSLKLGEGPQLEWNVRIAGKDIWFNTQYQPIKDSEGKS